MIGLIKDTWTLVNLELPASFDKKRVIANFLILYARSLPKRLVNGFKGNELIHQNIKIESDVWKSFNHIISMYVKYISTRYLTQTFVIRGVATGWHSKSYIDFLKNSFTKKHIDIIPKDIQNAVDNVSTSISENFEDMNYDIVNRWLLTYQYGLSKFIDDNETLSETLSNTHVIELGAGTGANIAVHASLSKEGVSIFDIPPMLAIQKRILNEISGSVEMCDAKYYSDTTALMEDAKKKPYIIVSYWAFTEFPMELRKTLEPLIQGSEFAFFACNSVFEGIDNLEYFEELGQRLDGKTITSEVIDWNPYKKHSYVMIK